MCQKAAGNYFMPLANAQNDDFTVTRGEIAWFHSSDIVRRGFCRNCGTPLVFDVIDGTGPNVALGSLDDPSAITPKDHFAIESKVANWEVDDGLPGTRLDEHVALTVRWKKAYGEDVVPGVGATRAP
jgi:hypothetical protein